MKVVLFTGPTLSANDALTILDAATTKILPPVAQGDVYRAALERPYAIGIVDGYFEREPAVWHKEILWALSEGVHVFGSASMGALRAAELSAYGMEGVGAIFEAIERGLIEDDDEVAVAHGDADSGFRPLSEALVNIRATLDDACAGSVIDGGAREVLLGIARALYYPDRSWRAVLDGAQREGMPPQIVDALAAFLPDGQRNLKREDAMAMVRLIAERVRTAPLPKQVAFSFEHTDAWDQVARRGRRAGPTAPGAAMPGADGLAEEARLDGDAFTIAHRGALLRALADEEMRRHGARLDDALRSSAASALAALHDSGDGGRARFLSEADLDERRFDELVESEARLLRLEAMHEPDILRLLPDELRASGRYPALAARARDKKRVLEARGLADPTLSDLALVAGDEAPRDEAELTRWYFEHRLGRSLPRTAAARLRALALPDEDALRRAALREYLYLRLQPGAG